MPTFIVKAVNIYYPNAVNNSNNSYVPQGYNHNSLEDCGLFHETGYEQIFGKPRYSDKKRLKLYAFVKISFEGRSIYRRYLTDNSISGIQNNEVGLTPSSIRLLSTIRNSQVVGKEVKVSKGCWFMYYWSHPFHATRISFKVGFVALVLSILSFALSLFSVFKH